MTGPLILTDYACVPPCKPCKESGECQKASTIVPPPPPLDGPFLPGDLDRTSLKCGDSIPWPVITLLGSGGLVWCSEHGWQKVTKKETDAAKKRAKKRATESDQLDIPPF